MFMYVLVTQSCLTLCDPVDCSPPGCSVHGILQARILEWVAMLSFRVRFHIYALIYNICFSLSDLNFTLGSLTSVHLPFGSVAQSHPTPCNPMDCRTPGLPVHRQLPEFTQTYAHRVSDAIQPSHPLSPPFPPAFDLSQHQSLFQ